MYRPDDWNEVLGDEIAKIPEAKLKRPIMSPYLLYAEAGADAILEALSKEADGGAIWFGRTDSGDLLIYNALPKKG